MPKLVEDNVRRARCPVCRKIFPVPVQQVGCRIECPLCHASFRLFEADLVKPRHLVLHPPHPRRRANDILIALVMALVAVGSLGALYAVWKRTLATAGAVSEPRPPEYAWPTAAAEKVQKPTGTRLQAPEDTQRIVAASGNVSNAANSGAGDVATGTPSIVLSVRQVGPLSSGVPAGEKGERVANFPLVLYANCEGALPFTPSGYMGNFEEMDFDDCCTTSPYEGDSCIRITYKGRHQWVGVAWQDPPNNWGDIPGGYDLSGAQKLTFWARGKTGAEYAQFKMGLIGRTKKYADTARITTGKVRLTKDWKKYELPLQGLDLSRIVTAFVVVLEGAPTPVVVYLDHVQFE
jgi:hypothetical protein